MHSNGRMADAVCTEDAYALVCEAKAEVLCWKADADMCCLGKTSRQVRPP